MYEGANSNFKPLKRISVFMMDTGEYKKKYTHASSRTQSLEFFVQGKCILSN